VNAGKTSDKAQAVNKDSDEVEKKKKLLLLKKKRDAALKAKKQ
jgi:hypothetical protein